jgi:hypothetical protein
MKLRPVHPASRRTPLAWVLRTFNGWLFTSTTLRRLVTQITRPHSHGTPRPALPPSAFAPLHGLSNGPTRMPPSRPAHLRRPDLRGPTRTSLLLPRLRTHAGAAPDFYSTASCSAALHYRTPDPLQSGGPPCARLLTRTARILALHLTLRACPAYGPQHGLAPRHQHHAPAIAGPSSLPPGASRPSIQRAQAPGRL